MDGQSKVVSGCLIRSIFGLYYSKNSRFVIDKTAIFCYIIWSNGVTYVALRTPSKEASVRIIPLLFLLAACSKDVELPKKSVVTAAPIPVAPVATPKPAPKVRSWKDDYGSVTPLTLDNVEDWRDDMETETVLVEYDEDGNEQKTTIPPYIKKGAKITVDDVVGYLFDQYDGNCVLADDGCYLQIPMEKDGVWYLVTEKQK